VIRVLIAEDQALLRQALASILAREADIEVVAEVSRGDEVIAAVAAQRPDVALLDIEMPGADGLALTRDLTEQNLGIGILILTVFARPGYLRRALDNGARGFILKDASPADLATAIRKVYAGEKVIDPKLAVEALEHGTNPLTSRESEVLRLSADGATAGDLARRLGISEGTVRNHLSIAIQKTEARTKTEAARVAEDRGWL